MGARPCGPKRRTRAAATLAGALLTATAHPAAAFFERIDASSRALGFGEAYVALANDAAAVSYNPAGLSTLAQPDVQFGVAQPYFVPDLLSSTIAVAWPAFQGGVGAAWHRLGNEFSSESLWTLSYGRWVYRDDLSTVHLGASLKIGRVALDLPAESTLQDGSTAVTLDLGGRYTWRRRLSLGATLCNLGEPDFEFDAGGSSPWESYGEVGVAYRWRPESTITLQWTSNRRSRDAWHGGAEIWFYDVFAVRAGVWATEFAGGVGLKTQRLEIDASFVTHAQLGLSGRLTVVVPVGGWK